MRIIRQTTQFKKDAKRMGKRGKNFLEFKGIISKLACGIQLELKYYDHILVGQHRGTRECHIEPDWLLIYEITDDELILVRTGSHADLFK